MWELTVQSLRLAPVLTCMPTCYSSVHHTGSEAGPDRRCVSHNRILPQHSGQPSAHEGHSQPPGTQGLPGPAGQRAPRQAVRHHMCKPCHNIEVCSSDWPAGVHQPPAASSVAIQFQHLQSGLAKQLVTYRCRVGAEAAEEVLAQAWPDASQPPKAGAFANVHVCGRQYKEQVGRSLARLWLRGGIAAVSARPRFYSS